MALDARMDLRFNIRNITSIRFKMSKKKIAIALVIDGELRENIELAFSRLKKNKGIHWLSKHTVAPHITLCSGAIKSSKDLSEVVSKIAASNSKFTEISRGLGVFITQTPVVHIRWPANGPLKLLRDKCYEDTKNIWEQIDFFSETNFWVPKTTIAVKDTSNENLSAVLTAIDDINFTIETAFNEISFIEVIGDYEIQREVFKF